MPWSPSHFPPSMRHLSPLARGKAIEIANALLGRGCEERDDPYRHRPRAAMGERQSRWRNRGA